MPFHHWLRNHYIVNLFRLQRFPDRSKVTPAYWNHADSIFTTTSFHHGSREFSEFLDPLDAICKGLRFQSFRRFNASSKKALFRKK